MLAARAISLLATTTVLLMCTAGCFAEGLELEEFDVPVGLALEGSDLRLFAGDVELDGDPAPPELEHPAPERPLGYEVRDQHGELERSGIVPDPRHLRVEWLDDDGAMQGFREETDRGAHALWLPSTGGELRLFEDGKMDGAPLASASFAPRQSNPQGIDSMDRALLEGHQLRRQPRRLWGSNPLGEGVHILILPEGFTSAELEEFRRAAFDMMDRLVTRRPALRDHADKLNAWYIDIPSAESGISVPAEGRDLNTAFDVAVRDRDALLPSLMGRHAASYLRMRWGMDIAALLVNTPNHRGVAVGNTVTLSHTWYSYHILAHELGHALFGLADEYVEQSHCTLPYRLHHRFRPNVDRTSDPRRIKWAHLIDEHTPMPTDGANGFEEAVGAFEGAGYCEEGWYRPQHTCLMRSITEPPCAVCRAEMDAIMARR